MVLLLNKAVMSEWKRRMKMDVKKIIENTYKAHIAELLLMPALLYTFELGNFIYWVILILVDQYILKHENILEMLTVFQEETYSKEIKKIVILEMCILACLIITFIKSWKVGVIYVANDLILMIAEAASYGKRKKN